MSTPGRAERRRNERERQRIIGDTRYTGGPVMPVPVEQTHADLPDVAPGEHLWIMAGVWRITNPEDARDPGVQKYLDLENLLTIEGPGCFICEEPWSVELAARPCPGDPS